MNKSGLLSFGAATAATAFLLNAYGSSHREAPAITSTPKLDATDFYAFNSYETGRSDYVTLIANYLPLQDAYGGPNYFALDPDALYEIHVDNTGDAVEDLTFQFRFSNEVKNIALPIGPTGNQKTNSVPVINVGQIAAGNLGALNRIETYTLNVVRGPRRTGESRAVTNAANASTTFEKPVDNIGNKSIPDYEAYANAHIHNITIPGCDLPGRVFVGQRKDPFVVNLGETFDLVNISTSPLGPVDANRDSLYNKNSTSIILEVPKQCLTSAGQSVIACWTTASKVENGTISQMSRLGQPLVNEVVIGLRDKDKFNTSEPKDDGSNFLDYVTHPTLPTIIELLYGAAGVKAPTAYPRQDLVTVFLTGIPNLNQLGVAEMLRLNTATPALPAAQQNNLGVIGGDNAGFPNGRRPGDDVVDIALRVVMGKLLTEAEAPSGQLPFTDGALVNAGYFSEKFPYLRAPLPGSPNEYSVTVTLQAAASVQGPYRSVPATYDSATRKLTAGKPDEATGFFRARANGKITFDGVTVGADNVSLGVK
ncbi:MAG: DUF4331 domain-containing protein [Verrucomicrobiales bacterium]|nr:DUF4331 domain-containing protein [Verrucomicrobiales bacterium]